MLKRIRRLVDRAEALATAMDFRPLYRPERHLFAIGFNVVQGRLDSACYDLLASEACLTSYLAVARGEAPAPSLVSAWPALHSRSRRDSA